MKITLITVGKIKEKYLRDAIAEYSKRLSRYCKLEIIEVADEKTPDHASDVVENTIRDNKPYHIYHWRIHWFGQRSARKIGLCIKLFQDDLSTPVDAGHSVRADIQKLSDHQR